MRVERIPTFRDNYTYLVIDPESDFVQNGTVIDLKAEKSMDLTVLAPPRNDEMYFMIGEKGRDIWPLRVTCWNSPPTSSEGLSFRSDARSGSSSEPKQPARAGPSKRRQISGTTPERIVPLSRP